MQNCKGIALRLMALDIERPQAAFTVRAGETQPRSTQRWFQLILYATLFDIKDTAVEGYVFYRSWQRQVCLLYERVTFVRGAENKGVTLRPTEG